MVCLLSPSLWLSFHPLCFLQKYRLKALVKHLREQGIHTLTTWTMGQVLKRPWRQLEQHPGELDKTLQLVGLLLILKNVAGNQPR